MIINGTPQEKSTAVKSGEQGGLEIWPASPSTYESRDKKILNF